MYEYRLGVPKLYLHLLYLQTVYVWHSRTTKADQMSGYLIEEAPDINSRASEGVARTRIELVLPPWEGGVLTPRRTGHLYTRKDSNPQPCGP